MVAWIDLMSMWVVDPLIWTAGPLGTPRVNPSFSDLNRLLKLPATSHQIALGEGRLIGFSLESSFRDIREDIVPDSENIVFESWKCC